MRRDGFSLVEVTIASLLFLVVMVMAWAGFSVLDRGGRGLLAGSEPRQQMRVALGHLQNDLRMASYIYPEPSYTLLATSLSPPPLGGTGNGLVYALPENAQPPLTFTVCALFARPRSRRDSNNPQAYELVYYSVEGIDPPTSDLPSEVDPETLPSRGTTRVFDLYLDGPTGFEVARSADGHSFEVRFRIRRQPARGELQRASHSTVMTVRNDL